MTALNDQQVDFILDDLHKRGIRLEGLQHNLLDHICILVEERLEPGGDFATVYASIIPSFYKKELYELEEEALFLASIKGPHLVLDRWGLFLLLLSIVISPYLVYLLQWGFVYVPPQYMPDSMVTVYTAMIFALFPLLTVLVTFFTPARFEPLIPWRSKVLLGLKPFIRVLPTPAG